MMKCPKCLANDGNDASLSIVCNTWPVGTNPPFLSEHCVCGHPWLETAKEDYWLFREGETDKERDARNKYPSVEDWFNTTKGTAA